MKAHVRGKAGADAIKVGSGGIHLHHAMLRRRSAADHAIAEAARACRDAGIGDWPMAHKVSGTSAKPLPQAQV